MEKRQIKIVSIIMSIALLIVGMAFVLSNNVESRASNTNENVTPHSSSAYIVCSAKDQLTESFEGDVSRADADGMVTIVSTIQFYIPEAPRDCRVEGKLIDATTEKPLHDDAGNEFTSTISFTAANVNGNAIIMYKAPAALVAGKTIATTEKLFYDDVEIDSCDLNAPLCNQVRYPDIEVSTLDGNTGEHVGLAANNASLNVVVQYNNLNGGMPYFIEGTLVDAETGNPILNTNGQTITASTEFYGGMYQLRAIKEPQAVINEFYGYLDRLQKHYDENGIDIELIYHPIKENDPHERDIKKFLGDMRGWIEKNVATNGRGEFIGVVSTDMRGDGEEEAGLFSVSVDAIIEAVISTLPENERAEFEHMFKIPFAEALRLQYLRSLDISDSSIARAKDKLTELKNATPQVFAETLPPINGSNFDVRTAESALIAYLDAKITQSSYPLDDYIDYTDLWEFLHAGEWYDELKASPTYMNIKARAVDYLKAVDVLDAKNVAVPFTVDITATSYDNKTLAANGQAVLQINLPSEIVKGKRVSVATRIKTVATNNTEYKWLEERVTTFKEIKQAPADPQRAVFYPAASSYVHSFIDGHPHAASIDDDNMTRFADTVSFTNLLPGKKYEVCGTVVDKNSGAPLKDATNGMPIVKMFEFTADNATGTIDVPFEFDARATGIDKSTSGADAVSDVVVFEEIRLIGNAENGVTDKKLVAEHKDINDENARISIDANLEDSQTPLAETGDQASHAMAIGGIALAILSICFVMRRRNGHSI